MPQRRFWKLADLGTWLGLVLTTRAHLRFPSSPFPPWRSGHCDLMRSEAPFTLGIL